MEWWAVLAGATRMKDQTAIDTIVRVEVTDEPIIPGRSGTNERGAWTIPPKHPCWLHQGDRYPVRIELPVPEAGRPRPGFYLLAGTPFKVGANGGRVNIQFDDRAIQLVSVDDLLAILSKAPGLKVA